MSKLLDCPECDKKGVPVQNTAIVCSTKCRMRRHRRKGKARLIKETKNENSSR